ncbi:helix-turn-helix domain-containing protein [Streptosporangium sp. NPDC000239]|uniref:helix-turn-helix domain-containing protein n=1 Tax=Streptosporangium sp. NPDC000239 TaxID=3154248 RepID=UPI003333C5E8
MNSTKGDTVQVNDATLRGNAEAAAQAAEGGPVSLDHEAVEWAWAQPITNNPGARIVLICMARRVDDIWECTASQEEIAEDAMLSARSVRRHMEQLEEDGRIRRQRRFDEKGHRLPDLCRLNPAANLPANLAGRQVTPMANLAGRDSDHRPGWPVGNQDNPDAPSSEPAANLASGQTDLWPDWPVGEGDETDTPRSDPVAKLTSGQIGRASSSPTENYSSSSTKKRKGGAGGNSSTTKPRTDEHPRFAEWYAAYPLRDKRPDAVKAFNRAIAKVGDAQILIDGAKRYAAHDPRVKRGYIKGPSVWLNNECWNDEIPPEPASQPQVPATDRPGNGSGSQVPPRGPRQSVFRSKREKTA